MSAKLKKQEQSDFLDDENTTEDDIDIDIVIVGAGLTGLICAYNILRKSSGLEVLIIEAKSEVGGRLLSGEYGEAYYASFSQSYVTRLVEALNLRPFRARNLIDKRKILYTKDGPMDSLSGYVGAEVRSFFQSVPYCKKTWLHGKSWPNERGTTVMAAGLFPGSEGALSAIYLESNLANLNDASTLWFLTMLNGAGGFFNRLKFALGDYNRYFIEGGMFQLVNKLHKIILSKNCTVKYNEPVCSIRYNDDRAYVRTKKSLIKCAIVIVATDPAQHKNIEIEPPLPMTFLTARELYTGTQNTFFNITYNQAFWENEFSGTIFATGNSNSDLTFMYDATCYTDKVNKYMLAGFMEDSGRKKSVFEIVNECFRAGEVPEFVNYKKYDALEYFETATGFPMSVMKPSLMGQPLNYMHTPLERLFFTSSEYATEWPGTVDGAIEAGENTAYLVLARIRPQTLTFNDMTHIAYKKSEDIPAATFPLITIQFLGILLNTAIFVSFLRPVLADIIRSFKR